MYISKISIEGYKNCKEKSEIEFNKGLNIIVGENASGKTTIINALRLILREREMSYIPIAEDDFYQTKITEKKTAKNIKIDLEWSDLSSDEEVTFLSWCDADFKAKLHYEVENKKNQKGYYKRSIWGGASKASAFEEETFDCIDCIYLPPLRDAEERLTAGRRSRLAVLLDHQYSKEEDKKKKLEEKMKKANEELLEEGEIIKARGDINKYIKDSMGSVFGQTVNLQFSKTSYLSILRSIKMVFFPEIKEDINKISIDYFNEIAMNSLGYNNLLFIATILAELETAGREKNLFTVLLIEEPEAHLHPQLQIKLVKYLEQLEKNNIQIIMTTHSSVLASSVSIVNLIHLNKSNGKIQATSFSKLNIEETSKKYINRWLDATKSTLLFSKGVIFVEGISEAMLIPELAKTVLRKYNNENKKKLPESLEEAGVSVINIDGINFKHFYQLFCDITGNDLGIRLPVRCSGITDKDPKKQNEGQTNAENTEKNDEEPSLTDDEIDSSNSALELIDNINKSNYARLFVSPLETFEYDLAMEDNISFMLQVLYDLWPSKEEKKGVKKECKEKRNFYEEAKRLNQNIEEKKQAYAEFIYKKINSKKIGKGLFAQELADKLKKEIDKIKKKTDIEKFFNVPKYIEDAIIWACGGDIND